MFEKSCAFTGHRPARFSFGYNENDERCLRVKSLLSKRITALITEDITTYYSGMALGIDQWAAEIILDMKQRHSGLRLIAVRPCENQANSWSVEQRKRHYGTLALCDEVVTLHPCFTRSCIFERNRYLIDHAGYLLAVYDGGSDGGTAYTVRYARQQGRKLTLIHPNTLEIST